jgi:hypothetical protein
MFSERHDVYVSDTSNHCLKKVAANGTLSAVAGCLLPAGNTNGAFGVGKLNNPAGIAYMNYVNSSNASQWTKGILIADRGSNLIRIYKIAGVGPFTGQVTNTGDLDRVACGGTDHDENLSAAFISCSAPYGVAAVGTSKFCFSNSGYHNVRCVDPQLTITNTVMGAPQGLSSSNYSFLRAPFGASDQSGVRAFIDDNYSTQSYGVLWSPVPPLSPSAPYEPWGTLASPWGVTAIDNASIAVVETSGGHLIRKIRLP